MDSWLIIVEIGLLCDEVLTAYENHKLFVHKMYNQMKEIGYSQNSPTQIQ